MLQWRLVDIDESDSVVDEFGMVDGLACSHCGYPLEIVRPGKYQCEYCYLKNQLKEAEFTIVGMREIIESMIKAKGPKYTEEEMPPETHSENSHQPCLLCLKRNQMLIHNSVIENLEQSFSIDAGKALQEYVKELEQERNMLLDIIDNYRRIALDDGQTIKKLEALCEEMIDINRISNGVIIKSFPDIQE